MSDRQTHDRFHGRVRGNSRICAWPGCAEAGEFRAPNPYGRVASPNGPGDYQWLCLDHVREFNTRYDYFKGMSQEEIEAAQMPAAGWDRATRAFAQAGVDMPPSWANFADPLDAISARFKSRMAEATPAQRNDGRHLTAEDRQALGVLGLDINADRKTLRTRYSELVRKYHPDKNGGDRSFEKKLQQVVEAYQLLKVIV
jgi:hypothetical protein